MKVAILESGHFGRAVIRAEHVEISQWGVTLHGGVSVPGIFQRFPSWIAVALPDPADHILSPDPNGHNFSLSCFLAVTEEDLDNTFRKVQNESSNSMNAVGKMKSFIQECLF
ncbi:hypothetical protein Y1Q_0012453 [Alligator mississippiensis]|uniref:Uncharacterized protein n=1 Tax=Alligator mississippiensis TaxID=8496 RepID=A0A151M7N9_ALLMI|nr:hypothetical protein Y1Q_0012453 [Alligator mississippiensis]